MADRDILALRTACAARAWARYRRFTGRLAVAAILAISLSLIYLKGAGEPIPIRMMIAILAGLGLSVLLGTALMAFFFLRNESSRRDAASRKTENDD